MSKEHSPSPMVTVFMSKSVKRSIQSRENVRLKKSLHKRSEHRFRFAHSRSPEKLTLQAGHWYAMSIPALSERRRNRLNKGLIFVLLIADFAIAYQQRLARTWIFHQLINIQQRKAFSNDLNLTELATGFLTLLVGMATDSYIGRPNALLIAATLAVSYSFLCFGFSFSFNLNYLQDRIALFLSPVLIIFGGVRWGYLMEQVRIPLHLVYLELHTFLFTFIRNCGRSTSLLAYVNMHHTFEGFDRNVGIVYTGTAIFASFINLVIIVSVRKFAFTEKVYPGVAFKAYHYIWYCWCKKLKDKKNKPKKHWHDYGLTKFDPHVAVAAKPLIKLPIVFMPLIFNALLRGTLTDIWEKQLRYFSRPVEPEITMNEINNYASTIVLPIAHFGIKPILRKCSITKDIQFVSFGYFLIGLSAIATCITHFFTDAKGGYLGDSQTSELVFFNALNSSTIIKSITNEELNLPPRQMSNMFHSFKTTETETIIEIHNGVSAMHGNHTIVAHKGKINLYLINEDGLMNLGNIRFVTPEKIHSNAGFVISYLIDTIKNSESSIALMCEGGKRQIINSNNAQNLTLFLQSIGKCEASVYDPFSQTFGRYRKATEFQSGGVYGFLLYNKKRQNLEIFTIVQPTLNKLILFPQMLLAVLGDCIMFPSLMKFCYMNAPKKMRSTVFSFGVLADGLGRGIKLVMDVLTTGASTTLLNSLLVTFATVYIIYIFLIVRIRFVKENLGDIA